MASEANIEKMEFLVLGVQFLDFVDKVTGECIKGINVSYIAEKEDSKFYKGFKIAKVFLPADCNHSIEGCPAYYDFYYKKQIIKGKLGLKIFDIKFSKNFDGDIE